MPRADRGASSACEGFRKHSANAIEFGGFTQHGEALAACATDDSERAAHASHDRFSGQRPALGRAA